MLELLRQRDVTSRYLIRGVKLWVGVRLLMVAVILLSGGTPDPIESGLLTPLLAGALGYVDLVRRRELALLANLGIPGSCMAATIASGALVGELAIALVGVALA